MIRSGIGTDPEVLRHHPLAQRVAGAECRDQFSRPFSSRESYFLLTFPLIERQGGPISLGPQTILKSPGQLTGSSDGAAHMSCSIESSYGSDPERKSLAINV